MTDRNTISQVIESLFEDWIDKNINVHPLAVENMRILETDALALLKEQETGHWIYLENCSNSGVYCSECHTKVFDNYPFKKKFSYFCPHCGTRMEGETERL